MNKISFLRRFTSLLALLILFSSMLPTNNAQAASSFKVRNATVTENFINHDSFCDKVQGQGTHVCCWTGAAQAYAKIWRASFQRSDKNNMLSNLSANERKMTVANLKLFFGQATPGANVRFDKSTSTTSADESGHNMLFLKQGTDGAYFLECNYDGKGGVRCHYWTWKKLVSTYGSRYPYIKYITWPGAKKVVTSLNTPVVKASNTSGGVKIKWDAIKNAASYTVYRDGKKLATVDDTAYTDKNAKNGTTYTYSVQAHYKNVNSKMSANVKIKFLSAPSLSSVKASSYRSGSYQLKVAWKQNAIAQEYEIQYSKNKDFSNSKTETLKGTSTSIVLYAKGTYYVRIRAVNSSYKSAWSSCKSVSF